VYSIASSGLRNHPEINDQNTDRKQLFHTVFQNKAVVVFFNLNV